MLSCQLEYSTVIGVGSVVVKPIPDFAVVAGNPARIIRYRVTVTKKSGIE
jgi:acetyltransferase-like isoleucine patch superfamily enzyme